MTTFDFHGKKAVATGAGGAIGGEIARGLAQAGAEVAIWDISPEAARAKADEINQDFPNKVLPVECNVVSKDSVEAALAETIEQFGTVDFLLNGAGGSHKDTTTSPELEFFDIDPEAVKMVMDLNYLSAVLPSQAVGRVFAAKGEGAVVNITSIGGGLPLSRALAYSNGKAAADSFTRWLAVHMATTYASKNPRQCRSPGLYDHHAKPLPAPRRNERRTDRSRRDYSQKCPDGPLWRSARGRRRGPVALFRHSRVCHRCHRAH